jgi:hypothetical protein
VSGFQGSIGKMKFNIDESYLTSVGIRKEWSMFRHIAKADLTPDQVFKMIKGEDICSSLSSEDHPEFAKLREQLATDGYIEIERRWWNGDHVLKPFTLNGAKFKKGEQFPSGCAMSGHLGFKKFG